MLNQHSYSQSEPQRHIAARLGADENGTLGPDLKNIQRLLTRDLRVRLGLYLQGRDGSDPFKSLFKHRGICPFYTPSYLYGSLRMRELNGALKRESLDANSFITCKTEGHGGFSRSLPLFLGLL